MKITQKDLKAVCERLNNLTGNPVEPYKNVDGKFVSQIGCYHLSGAYGGYALNRMCNEAGGCSDIFGYHMPKAELYRLMQAYIKGIELNK